MCAWFMFSPLRLLSIQVQYFFVIPGVTEDPRFEGLTCKKMAIQLTT